MSTQKNKCPPVPVLMGPEPILARTPTLRPMHTVAAGLSRLGPHSIPLPRLESAARVEGCCHAHGPPARQSRALSIRLRALTATKATLLIGLLLIVVGCGQSQREYVSSIKALSEFQAAGPVMPAVDVDQLFEARRRLGPYRVNIGDVLEIAMPAILHAAGAELPVWSGKDQPYLCRVDRDGRIPMPIIGPIPAAGKSLAEIEEHIVELFHPRYVVQPPAVVANVHSHRTAQVSVIGAVNQPGVYELTSDEMSLVSLLMKAGGIKEQGAAVIYVRRAGDSRTSDPIALPVRGLNIPFADVILHAGDSVVVDGLCDQKFTVIGLVKSSGAYPYPPGLKYNLLQAIAFAGGLNEVADPQSAKIYRQTADGDIVYAKFSLNQDGVVGGANVYIKPGDVVAVEQDDYTRSRLLLAEVFRVTTGLNFFYRLDSGNDD